MRKVHTQIIFVYVFTTFLQTIHRSNSGGNLVRVYLTENGMLFLSSFSLQPPPKEKFSSQIKKKLTIAFVVILVRRFLVWKFFIASCGNQWTRCRARQGKEGDKSLGRRNEKLAIETEWYERPKSSPDPFCFKGSGRWDFSSVLTVRLIITVATAREEVKNEMKMWQSDRVNVK